MLSGCCCVVCSLVRSDEPDEKFERTDDEEVDVLLLSSSLEIATGRECDGWTEPDEGSAQSGRTAKRSRK